MPKVGRVQATDQAKSYGRRASLLSIGVGITGLITYLYFAIASHELSRDQYGQVAVLWSAVFIVVSVLQRPVEQLLSRTVSENLAHDVPIGRTVRVAATIQLAVALGFDVVALALRTPIQDHLLDGNSTLYWIGVAAITAYGASYFARGFLAGSHRLTIYALQIISESVARTAFPFAVALGIASGQTAVALGIVAAPTLSLIVVPFAFSPALRRRGGEGAPRACRRRSAAAAPTDEFTLARGGRFAAGVFLIMLSEQTFLNAGVLLVNATRRRRGRGLHLQRPDDRPGAPPALPGGPDQPPPPPHHARLARRREGLPRLDPGDAAGDRRLRGRWSPSPWLIAGPAADADRLRQEAHLRPGRPGDRQRSAWASTCPRRPSTRRRSRADRCAVPRSAGSAARSHSSSGTSSRSSATTSPGGRSATWAPRRCSARCSTGSTASRSLGRERPRRAGLAGGDGAAAGLGGRGRLAEVAERRSGCPAGVGANIDSSFFRASTVPIATSTSPASQDGVERTAGVDLAIGLADRRDRGGAR